MKVKEIGKFGDFDPLAPVTSVRPVSSGEVECPECQSESRWELMIDHKKDGKELLMVCTSCQSFAIPLIPKGAVKPESIVMMDLRERVQRLEEKLEEVKS